jgi:hypothetical protein
VDFPAWNNVDDTRLDFSSQLVVVKLTIHHINHSSWSIIIPLYIILYNHHSNEDGYNML